MKKSVLAGMLLVQMGGNCSAMWYRLPAIDPAQQHLFWKASAAGTRLEKSKVEENASEEKQSEQESLPTVAPSSIIARQIVGQRASRAYGEPKKMSAKKRKLLFKKCRRKW